MKTLGSELTGVYNSLSAEQQSEMIERFQNLFENEPNELVSKFYAGIIEILEKEKRKMFDLEKTEKSVMNLFGLITAIQSSAENIEKHCESVKELCDISSEKLKDVWETVSEVENKSLSTAEMISFLITDDSVPDEISKALSDAVRNIFNRLPPDCTAQKLDETPEYIQIVLDGYEYAKNKEAESE